MEKETFSAKKKKGEKKMRKEWIICFIVIFSVAITDIITQNYTKESVEVIDSKLETLKEELKKEEIQKENLEEQMQDVMKVWKEKYEKLAYYIEHDELEKVETELVSLKANIDSEECKQGLPDLNRCIFILEHIKEKSALQVKNIF